MNIHTIILAAGEGTRMNSNRAKSLQTVGGTSMLEKICRTAGKISKDITLIVGFDKDSIINEANTFTDLKYHNQPSTQTNRHWRCCKVWVGQSQLRLKSFGSIWRCSSLSKKSYPRQSYRRIKMRAHQY